MFILKSVLIGRFFFDLKFKLPRKQGCFYTIYGFAPFFYGAFFA